MKPHLVARSKRGISLDGVYQQEYRFWLYIAPRALPFYREHAIQHRCRAGPKHSVNYCICSSHTRAYRCWPCSSFRGFPRVYAIDPLALHTSPTTEQNQRMDVQWIKRRPTGNIRCRRGESRRSWSGIPVVQRPLPVRNVYLTLYGVLTFVAC